jgi:hypothetical protein
VWLPARAKWVPDAIAAFLGVLLVGLPEASTLLGQVEIGLMAVLMGAIAAAPGHTAPEDGEASATKAGTVSLVLLSLMFAGCAPTSLEAARARSPEPTVGATPGARDDARCDRLDNRYVAAGTTEKVALSLSGAQGIGSVAIAASDPDKEVIAMGLGFGTVGTLGVAAGAGFVREHAASRWAEECQ